MDLFVLTLHVVNILIYDGETVLKCFHFIKYARNVITMRRAKYLYYVKHVYSHSTSSESAVLVTYVSDILKSSLFVKEAQIPAN